MAKIVRIPININQSEGNTPKTKPTGYLSDRISVLCYDPVDGTTENCIGIVSDTDAPLFLDIDGVSEIDLSTAEVIGTQLRPQIDVVTVESIVLPIVAKQLASEVLTQEEIDAITPDNPAPGINKSASFSSLLSDCIAEVA